MSVSPKHFYNILSNNGIDFFTGVPDSLLKEFCVCVDDNTPMEKHIIAANEGNAIAIAAGYYLGTGKLPLVYMQNSGLGNAINPILSLCDPAVYSIPMLIIVGWRGEPGVQDEPQHIAQGKVQNNLLHSIGIPFEIISRDDNSVKRKIEKGINTALGKNSPFVILVKKGTFDQYRKITDTPDDGFMSREESLEIILDKLPDDFIIVSTTGKTSREIFEIREQMNEPHHKDFLTVGSMGHCSSIATGLAVARPDRKIMCIDGDGALIMHMGSLTTIGKLSLNNYFHILINNRVHESVGGQETSIKYVNVSRLVQASGYKNVFSVSEKDKLKLTLNEFLLSDGPNFLEVKVKPGSRLNLGRPTVKPADNKKAFMDFIIKK